MPYVSYTFQVRLIWSVITKDASRDRKTYYKALEGATPFVTLTNSEEQLRKSPPAPSPIPGIFIIAFFSFLIFSFLMSYCFNFECTPVRTGVCLNTPLIALKCGLSHNNGERALSQLSTQCLEIKSTDIGRYV